MLNSYSSDLAKLRDELNTFEALMRPKVPLDEEDDILPFFRSHPHLAAYLGYANNNLVLPNLLGFEHPLLDFRCDIAIGDSTSGQFTLVELEDAKEASIFQKQTAARKYQKWASRYAIGFSQLVDWAWRIGQERQPNSTLEPIFDTTDPQIHYLLVIGRDHWLNAAGRARLEWRRRHNGIQGQMTTIWTYDFFLAFVQRRLAAAQAAPAPART